MTSFFISSCTVISCTWIWSPDDRLIIRARCALPSRLKDSLLLNRRRHSRRRVLPLMQSTTSAFPIGRNYAIWRRFSLSLFSLLFVRLWCSSRDFARSFVPNRQSSWRKAKRLELSIALKSARSRSLSLFHFELLKNAWQISEINSNHQKLQIGIIEIPSLESVEKLPRIEKILRLTQQVHGSYVSLPQPLTAKDSCSLLDFIGVIRFFHRGIINCMGHRPFCV